MQMTSPAPIKAGTFIEQEIYSQQSVSTIGASDCCSVMPSTTTLLSRYFFLVVPAGDFLPVEGT